MRKRRTHLVLVTGATGFLGSHLVDALLARGTKVRCLVRSTSSRQWLPHHHNISFVEGDLRQPEGLAAAAKGVSCIYHAAALKGSSSREGYEHTNVQGTAALAEAALACTPCPRLVYVSSVAAVGPSTNGPPLDERSPCAPVSTYGRTKLEGEHAIRKLAAQGQRLPFCIVRPPVIIGPRDKDLLTLFKTIAKGWMPRPAGPPRRVAILYVEDVVQATLLAGEHPRADGRTYILAQETPTWEEVGRETADILGVRARSLPIPKAAFYAAGIINEALAPLAGTTFSREKVREALHEWVLRGDAIVQELGFAYHWSFREGLQKTLEWYRRHAWLS